MIQQTFYPNITVDDSENDIIALWQSGKEDSNIIQIEREKLKELINKLLELL
jgi:N-acetylglutamate synthase/N-acetylornithine aminotransferase